MQHFQKLGVNLTPESTYMKEECGSRKTICIIYLISKRRSSIDQILIKIKHKVKQMVKFDKTTPSSNAHLCLSTTKHLGKIKLHMVFALFVISLKKFFEQTKI